MSWRAVGVGLLVAGLIDIGVPIDARGQEVSLDVSAGRVTYEPVSANVGTNNVMGTLRYDARHGLWVYATGGAPLRSSDPVWGAFGAGGRLQPAGAGGRRTNVGLDAGAHGFLFRDAVVDQIGSGVTIDAFPFVSMSSGPGSLELRGGWRGHTLSYAAATERRGLFEAGARATYGITVRVEADGRWVRADEGTYPFLGGTLLYDGTPLQAWVQAGRWLSTDLDEVGWSGGIGVALGSRATLWATVRQEPPDPLYWNAPRRSWSVGVTRRLGGGAAAPLPASRADAGAVVIRISASDAPGAELAIAGDFNQWQPVPMQREGRDWVIRLPLAPGVYHYAFRSGAGEWFVPASVAGRRADGMGGHVAVLVVS